VATVRIETPPGDRLQADFGHKRLLIAGLRVRIFLLVTVLSYSRRLFVKAFLNERGADWREGIAAAFLHFGGVPRTVRGDNARALMQARDRATGTVIFHPPTWPSVHRTNQGLQFWRSVIGGADACSICRLPTRNSPSPDTTY
jgi:transposase